MRGSLTTQLVIWDLGFMGHLMSSIVIKKLNVGLVNHGNTQIYVPYLAKKPFEEISYVPSLEIPIKELYGRSPTMIKEVR